MTDEQILLELQKINKKLDIFSNPLKSAGHNFSSGIFRSLGNLFGTVIIAGVIYYLLSILKINFSELLPGQL